MTRSGLRVYADQPETVPELIERAVRCRGTAPAVRDIGGRRLTYEELWEETGRVAATLQQRHGVEPGDQVAFLASNGLDLLVGVIATWRVGGVAVMLNARYTATEIEQQLALCSPRVVLTGPESMAKVPGAAHRLGDAGDGRFDPPALRPTDPALVNFTSGTTAASKAVVQSHLNLVSAAETWARCLDLQPSDSTVVVAPMYHTTGLNGQSLPVLAAGGSLAIMPRFDAASLVDELAAGAASFFHAAPIIYILALRAARGQRARGLRSCVSGGSFVGRPLVAQAMAFAPGCDFRISYAMTETSSSAVLTPPGWIEQRPGDAIGIAVPVDDVDVDDEGEILFRGATVITRDVWLRSGDLGTIDGAGFVTVVDRIKDIINRGGEKVASIEIEDVLGAHPGVIEVAVVAKSDDVYGEVPKAFVVGDAHPEMLQSYAAERLARFKIPVEFVFVPQLPRNAAGKVLKSALRAPRASSR